MAKNKSTAHIEKLGAYDSFRAPWESEAGGDADVDKPTLKRLVYNLRKDLAVARDTLDDTKAEVAEVEAERDEAKSQASDGSGAEAQKKIDKLTADLQKVTDERDGLVKDKETAETRKEVLGEFEALHPKAAKYVTGETQEELEASLKEVAEDWGIDLDTLEAAEDPEDGDDEDNDLDKVARTSPRTKTLRNVSDRQNGKGADGAIDFDAVADDVIAGGSVFR